MLLELFNVYTIQIFEQVMSHKQQWVLGFSNQQHKKNISIKHVTKYIDDKITNVKIDSQAQIKII